MAICDLTMATGGQPMVRAAYSSGKPAYGVGDAPLWTTLGRVGRAPAG